MKKPSHILFLNMMMMAYSGPIYSMEDSKVKSMTMDLDFKEEMPQSTPAVTSGLDSTVNAQCDFQNIRK